MTLLDVALLVLALAFLIGLVRTIIGPTIPDRAIAADVALYAVVAALGLIAVRTGSEAYVDVVIIATLLSFLATVALGALIARIRS